PDRKDGAWPLNQGNADMETELTGSWKTRHRVLQDPLPGSWKTLRVSLYSLTLFLLSDIVGGTVMQNRHPVDRLHDVRVELKRLEAEEEKLRAYLLEHPSDRTGEEHIAVVAPNPVSGST